MAKVTDWVKPGDSSGEFKRQTSTFRERISSAPGARFPPEAGRYHLFVSYACPWAHRTLITRKLKQLDDVVSFSAVHWHLGNKGWRFVAAADYDDDDDDDDDNHHDDGRHHDAPGENVIPDPVPGHEAFTHLSDIYFESDPSHAGRFTVPVLYDKHSKTIVSNESADIVRMLNAEFNHLIGDPAARALDLYPAALRADIDAVEDWHYSRINNGVYKSGFATSQAAYERSVLALFAALDRCENHLAARPAGQPFWFPGPALTEVDIRLWVTLIRFDPVYVQHFKCNLRDVRSGYPHLHRYMRQLYWNMPAFNTTTNFLHIKSHYTRSHTQINPLSIEPLGPLPHVLPLDDEVAAVAILSRGG